ncbi:MAG: CPBP family intramembrane glutamic endopeptidase [Bacteroidota bacterium]
MDKTLKVVLITAVSFGLYYALQEAFFADLRGWIDGFISHIGFSHLFTYFIVGLPFLVGLGLLHPFKNFPEALGLNQSLIQALVFALICTAPMLIGYAVVFDFNSELTFTQILTGAITAALMEELYFRAVLFGQIYRYTRIGFIPAIVFGALIFAAGHLYQSQELSTLIGIFLTTFMGAVLFAWAYVEWNCNLWVPIFLHLFMNLFWMMFSVSDNALGNNYGNLFRVATITLIIVLTIVYKRRKGLKMEVNRNTLIMKQGEES